MPDTDYPPRDEIDDAFTWELTQVYESPDHWETAFEALADRAETLRTRTGITDSPTALAEALAAVEEMLVTRSQIELYAQLRRNEDTTDEDRRDRHRRAQELSAEVNEAVRAVRREIQRNASRVVGYRQKPALEGWEAYLDVLLKQAPHTRDAAVEETVATFEPVVESQTDTIISITTGDFDPPTVEGPDGEQVTVDKGAYREALDNPDRSFRRRAREAYHRALADHEHALAAALTQKIRAQSALAEVRGYDSVRDMALSRPGYPDTGMHMSFAEETHDAVIEQVRSHLDPYHALLESRRECLEVETLRPWDSSVPLVDGEPPEISFAELRECILTAVEPLGTEYRERLAAFLTEGRVDVYPTANKRTDIPACCPSSPETGAFILANFRENLRTAFFLAHELGHAMHIELLREAQPPRYVTSPQPVSEVPSILHELLLADHLLEADAASLSPFVRERRGELLVGNVYGAGLSTGFNHDAYRIVEEGGDLTPDRLTDVYGRYATEFRDPIEDDTPGAGWRLQAYAREPYHYYQYVTGAVAAVTVHRRLKDGSISAAKYRDFLKTTGRRDSEELFESIGVDVTESRPYERVGEELEQVRAARLR